MEETSKRALAIDIAMRFIGTPYLWGGDDPVKGFDCSGFVIEVLKSLGKLPRSGDWTAEMLYPMFPNVARPRGGCLVFWHAGSDRSRIIHVEMCISNELSIGASGGGSKTKTVEDAINQNAYIKVRPFNSRSNIRGITDPFFNTLTEKGD